MRTCVLTFLFLSLACFILGSGISRAEELLPIGLTEEEMGRLDEIGKNFVPTRAPMGEVRNPAEWEPSKGVIIRWPLGIPLSLVAELSEDLVVTTIVAGSSELNSATNSYTSAGVNMANTNWLIAPTNSIWTRDYGPWFIFNDGQLGIVDHIYNRPRPLDDVIPQYIGADWGLPVFAMDLITTGGNHMSDGLGRSMSTKLVYNENPSLTNAEVDSIMLAFLGNDYTVMDYIESGGIHHIDCWAKFLNPTTIMVKDVPSGDYSYDLLNDRAEYLSQQISAWGQPYTIVRVYCPYGAAYTNSIILNNKVLVPTISSSWDAVAIQTYQDAMPGYEVLGFTGSWLDDDAIHCRTMGVPDSGMLFINHTPLGRINDPSEDITVGVHIEALSGSALIEDSTKVFYSVDGGEWLSAPLYLVTPPDSFLAVIPGQPGAEDIRYYIQAGDLSGRTETHPYIGEPWAHALDINDIPEIVSGDSISTWAGETVSYCPEYVDSDDTEHTITYTNPPVWLSELQDTLSGTAPSENAQYVFTVEVADPYSSDSQDIYLNVHICGDINQDGTGPDISDLTYLVNYLFISGDELPYPPAADFSGDGETDISDLTTLVNSLFILFNALNCGS